MSFAVAFLVFILALALVLLAVWTVDILPFYDGHEREIMDPVDFGWEEVRFTAECDPEGTGWCHLKDIDPDTCNCIGPTQDGVEYQVVDGVLYGRHIKS